MSPAQPGGCVLWGSLQGLLPPSLSVRDCLSPGTLLGLPRTPWCWGGGDTFPHPSAVTRTPFLLAGMGGREVLAAAGTPLLPTCFRPFKLCQRLLPRGGRALPAASPSRMSPGGAAVPPSTAPLRGPPWRAPSPPGLGPDPGCRAGLRLRTGEPVWRQPRARVAVAVAQSVGRGWPWGGRSLSPGWGHGAACWSLERGQALPVAADSFCS